MCFFTPERSGRPFACSSAASQLVPPLGARETALSILLADVVKPCSSVAFLLNVTTAIWTCCSVGNSKFLSVSSFLARALAAFCALVSRLSLFMLPDLSMTSTMSAGVTVVTVEEVLSPDAVRFNVYSSPLPPLVFTMLLLFDGFTLEFTMVTWLVFPTVNESVSAYALSPPPCCVIGEPFADTV